MNAMALERYRSFWAVAETKSFTRAAEKLFLSQPAVSQAVKKLEQDLGVVLFVRRTRGVSLTAEGAVLHAHVREAFNLIDAGIRRLDAMRRLEDGEIRVGSSDTLSQYVLLPVLEDFHRQYPDIRIHVTNGTSAETLALLRSGTIEFGLVNLPIAEDGVTLLSGPSLEEGFVAGPQYEPMAGRTLPLDEIAALPLVLLDLGSVTRTDLEQFFWQHGVSLHPAIELASHELLVEFAKAGLGVAHVVLPFVAQLLHEGTLCEIHAVPPLPTRRTGVAILKDAPLSQAAQQLLRQLTGADLFD